MEQDVWQRRLPYRRSEHWPNLITLFVCSHVRFCCPVVAVLTSVVSDCLDDGTGRLATSFTV